MATTRLPELVRDSRLETRFGQDCTIHLYHDQGGRRSAPRQERWTRERILGSGGYGIVWLEKRVAGAQQGSGHEVFRAVKEIRSVSSQLMVEFYKNELEALAKFSNRKYARCFVASYGWYEVPGSLFIPMEYCPHGDLRKYMIEHETLVESEAQEIISQLVDAISFMHMEGFAHRDLKPANILVKSHPPNEEWWVKICDMGLTKRTEAGPGTSTTVKGTPGFLPPEMLGLDGDPRKVDHYAADMWCLGETAFQILTGEPTFPTFGALFRYHSGGGEFPGNKLQGRAASQGAIEFITAAMAAQPDQRLTATQALDHGWIQVANPDTQASGEEEDLSMAPSFNLTSPDLYGDVLQASAPWSTVDHVQQSPRSVSVQEPKPMPAEPPIDALGSHDENTIRLSPRPPKTAETLKIVTTPDSRQPSLARQRSRRFRISDIRIPKVRLSFITAEDQARFETSFLDAVMDAETLSRESAIQIFRNEKFARSDATHIWDLANIRDARSLYFPEFALAMHLASEARATKSLPVFVSKSIIQEVSEVVATIMPQRQPTDSKRTTAAPALDGGASIIARSGSPVDSVYWSDDSPTSPYNRLSRGELERLRRFAGSTPPPV